MTPPTFVYAFGERGDDLIKIGQTISLKGREGALRSKYAMPRASMLFYLCTRYPNQIERYAHEHLRTARIYPRQEWFVVSLSDAVEAINAGADHVTSYLRGDLSGRCEPPANYRHWPRLHTEAPCL